MRHRTARFAALVLAAIAPTGLSVLPGAARATSAPAPSTAATGPELASNAAGRQQTGAAHPDATGQTVTDFTSSNWDGYFVRNAAGTTDFNAVSASWTVNPVTCSGTKKEWGVVWVGLDGWLNDVVEQGGTEAICRQGVPHYTVWWEMFPSNSIQKGFRVTPGDKINASVTFNPVNAEFTIVVENQTSGKTLSEATPCLLGPNGCPRTSAEVISEDVEHFDSGLLFPLPDYGDQSIKKASVTDVTGHTGSLSDLAWQLGQVTEASLGIVKQTTSDLTANGTSFTTTSKSQ